MLLIGSPGTPYGGYSIVASEVSLSQRTGCSLPLLTARVKIASAPVFPTASTKFTAA